MDISSEPQDTGPEADVCRFLGANLDLVKQQAKDYACKTIDEMPLEQLFDRFWQGRMHYGGTFDIEAIPIEVEQQREVEDLILYVLFQLCRDQR